MKRESLLKKWVEATGDYIKALEIIRGDCPEFWACVKFDAGTSLTYYYRNLSKPLSDKHITSEAKV